MRFWMRLDTGRCEQRRTRVRGFRQFRASSRHDTGARPPFFSIRSFKRESTRVSVGVSTATHPEGAAEKDPDYTDGKGTDIPYYIVKLPKGTDPTNLSADTAKVQVPR